MTIDEMINNANADPYKKNPQYGGKKDKVNPPRILKTPEDYIDRSSNEIADITDRYATDLSHLLPNAERYGKVGLTVNKSGENYEKNFAKLQSNWDKAYNSLARTLYSELTLGTIKAFSDIADAVGQAIGVSDHDYSNPVSQTLEEWQNSFNESHYIGSDPDENTILDGGFGNFGWWANQMPSIISSLTLLLPSSGIVKGVSYLGKLANINNKAYRGIRALTGAKRRIETGKDLNTIQRLVTSQKAADTAKFLMESGATASLSRLAENYQESRQTYTQMLEECMTGFNNLSDEEYSDWVSKHQKVLSKFKNIDVNDRNSVAKAIAGHAADVTFKNDWWNVVFDAWQLMALRNIKLGNVTRSLTNNVRKADKLSRMFYGSKTDEEIEKIIAAQSKTRKALSKAGNFFMGQGRIISAELSEGIEEMVNYVAQQEGLTAGRFILDDLVSDENKIKYTTFNERLYQSYLKDGQLWDSAFWGVAGGVAFQHLGSAFNRIKQKLDKEESALNVLPSWQVNTSDPEDHIRVTAIDDRRVKRDQFIDKYNKIKNGIDVFNSTPDNEVKFIDEVDGGLSTLDAKRMEETALNRLIDDFSINSYLNEAHVGNSELILDLFKDTNVVNALGKFLNLSENEAKELASTITTRMEQVQQHYDREINRLDLLAGRINAKDFAKLYNITDKNIIKQFEDKEIPLQYLQIMAANAVRNIFTKERLEQRRKELKSELNTINAHNGTSELDIAQLEDTLKTAKVLSIYKHTYDLLQEAKKLPPSLNKTIIVQQFERQLKDITNSIKTNYTGFDSIFFHMFSTEDSVRESLIKELDNYKEDKDIENIIKKYFGSTSNVDTLRDFLTRKGVDPTNNEDDKTKILKWYKDTVDNLAKAITENNTPQEIQDVVNKMAEVDVAMAENDKNFIKDTTQLAEEVMRMHNVIKGARSQAVKEAENTILNLYENHSDEVRDTIDKRYGSEIENKEYENPLNSEDIERLNNALDVLDLINPINAQLGNRLLQAFDNIDEAKERRNPENDGVTFDNKEEIKPESESKPTDKNVGKFDGTTVYLQIKDNKINSITKSASKNNTNFDVILHHVENDVYEIELKNKSQSIFDTDLFDNPVDLMNDNNKKYTIKNSPRIKITENDKTKKLEFKIEEKGTIEETKKEQNINHEENSTINPTLSDNSIPSDNPKDKNAENLQPEEKSNETLTNTDADNLNTEFDQDDDIDPTYSKIGTMLQFLKELEYQNIANDEKNKIIIKLLTADIKKGSIDELKSIYENYINNISDEDFEKFITDFDEYIKENSTTDIGFKKHIGEYKNKTEQRINKTINIYNNLLSKLRKFIPNQIKNKFDKNEDSTYSKIAELIETDNEVNYITIAKEIITNYITKENKINGLNITDDSYKAYVGLTELFRLINETVGDDISEMIYNKIIDTINSIKQNNKKPIGINDGKPIYLEIKDKYIDKSNILRDVRKSFNELAIDEVVDTYSATINSEAALNNPNESQRELTNKTINSLNIGDELQYELDDNQNILKITKDGITVGTMAIPEFDNNKTYHQVTDGWRVDVKEKQHTIESELKNLFKQIFANKEIQGYLNYLAFDNNKKENKENQAIADIIKHLNSISDINKYYIDGQDISDENKTKNNLRRVEHLVKLWTYAAMIYGSNKEGINKNLDKWFNNLYQSYIIAYAMHSQAQHNNTKGYKIYVKDDGIIRELVKQSDNVITGKKTNNSNGVHYTDLPTVNQALTSITKGCKISVGAVDDNGKLKYVFDNTLIIQDKPTANTKKGQSYLIIQKDGKNYYADVFGKVVNTEDNTLGSKFLSQIKSSINDNIDNKNYNKLFNIIKQLQDSKILYNIHIGITNDGKIEISDKKENPNYYLSIDKDGNIIAYNGKERVENPSENTIKANLQGAFRYTKFAVSYPKSQDKSNKEFYIVLDTNDKGEETETTIKFKSYNDFIVNSDAFVVNIGIDEETGDNFRRSDKNPHKIAINIKPNENNGTTPVEEKKAKVSQLTLFPEDEIPSNKQTNKANKNNTKTAIGRLNSWLAKDKLVNGRVILANKIKLNHKTLLNTLITAINSQYGKNDKISGIDNIKKHLWGLLGDVKMNVKYTDNENIEAYITKENGVDVIYVSKKFVNYIDPNNENFNLGRAARVIIHETLHYRLHTLDKADYAKYITNINEVFKEFKTHLNSDEIANEELLKALNKFTYENDIQTEIEDVKSRSDDYKERFIKKYLNTNDASKQINDENIEKAVRTKYIEEFLVETATNTTLMQALNTFEAKEYTKTENKNKSLLQLLFDILKKIFKFDDVKKGNLLEKAITTLDNEIEENKDVTKPIDSSTGGFEIDSANLFASIGLNENANEKTVEEDNYDDLYDLSRIGELNISRADFSAYLRTDKQAQFDRLLDAGERKILCK